MDRENSAIEITMETDPLIISYPPNMPPIAIPKCGTAKIIEMMQNA